MNIINVNIDFEQGICRNEGISVVTGDYASTKVVFEFNESATGTKIFEMKNPSDELVYADEIVDNEIVLTGQKDVVDSNGYIKYLDNSENVYWYDSTNNVIYNSSYEEATGVELDTLTKQTEIATLFTEEGDYTFEVSLYQDNSRLTSVCGYITANQEQVIVDGEEVQQEITLFDNLMNDLSEKIEEVNNLDIEASKSGKITTITITKKDGTTEEVELEDGKSIEYDWEGTSLGIRQEGESDYSYVDLKGSKGDAGAIKFEIVEELPTTGIEEDTIYLVPIEPDIEGNNYEEYIYVNGEWELLGKIGVQVDLSNYYTKQEIDTMIGEIDTSLTTLDIGSGVDGN